MITMRKPCPFMNYILSQRWRSQKRLFMPAGGESETTPLPCTLPYTLNEEVLTQQYHQTDVAQADLYGIHLKRSLGCKINMKIHFS
mmetsp:Transcript_35117/g.44365  ORF Transcript_35117/g.44365 Transcript_35117/m.44365 type:complete len:86 (+) Transcript_35117:1-258(+)